MVFPRSGLLLRRACVPFRASGYLADAVSACDAECGCDCRMVQGKRAQTILGSDQVRERAREVLVGLYRTHSRCLYTAARRQSVVSVPEAIRCGVQGFPITVA